MRIRPNRLRLPLNPRHSGPQPGPTGPRALRFLVVSLGLASLGARPHPTWAGDVGHSQVPGFAEIVAPSEGQSVQGIVTIRGTASHPAFAAYELSFGLDPDPTDTWFALTEPVDTPVVDGRLAIWDTGPITDGDYRLRLRVILQSGGPLVAIVEHIRVRNYTPTEVPAGPVQVAPPPEPTPADAASSDLTVQTREAAPPRPDRFRTALGVGVAFGGVLPAGLGLYLWVAPRARAYRGFLRMRRLHQRTDRQTRR